MIFDIEKKDNGVQFDFPGGGWIKLRKPSVDDFMRVRRACTENKPFLVEKEGQVPRVFNHEVINEEKMAGMMNDCTIMSWGDFYDKNGKEIPCTPENKTMLMRLDDPTFRDFVNEKLKALSKAGEQAKKEADENLSNG